MRVFVLACVSIALSVAAQFSLKIGMLQVRKTAAAAGSTTVMEVLGMHLNPGILIGFLLYGLGAVVWLSVLSKWDVSKAYPMIGLGFIATLAIGAWMGEAVTLNRVAGVALIAWGVYLISRS